MFGLPDAIIAYRVNDGAVEFVIFEETGQVAIFRTRGEAQTYADQNRLFQSGQADYQIIELTEL